MGGCVSHDNSSREVLVNQKIINERLQKDKICFKDEHRILMLGAGESGKSTIAKQMKILYLNGFSEEELIHFREIIHSNVIMSMRALLRYAEEIGMELQPENQPKAEFFITNDILATQTLTPKHAQYIKDLWADNSIKHCFTRASEFQINENAAYFFDKIEKVVGSFIPTEEDILRARSKTLGIKETIFKKDNANFRLVDVGGQRSERKKMGTLFC